MLAEEIGRRLRKMDKFHQKDEVVSVMNNFPQKLIDSNYDTSMREEIAKAGVRIFFMDLARVAREGRLIYRIKKEMDKASEVKNLLNKLWFR